MENSYYEDLRQVSFAFTFLAFAIVFPAIAVHLFASMLLGTIIGFTVSLGIFVWAFIYLNKEPEHGIQ